jgi:ABC-type nitrate/sulfonate/bicarbonate transport system ATPase subunit
MTVSLTLPLRPGAVIAVVGLPAGMSAALSAEWPDVLVLDHPVRGTGYFARLWLRDELADRLARPAGAVLLLTDDIEEAAQLADRVIVLREGTLAILGDVAVDGPRPRGRTDPAVLRAVEALVPLLEPAPGAARCA